ncbi:MAG: hypothetical protein SH850_18230, partial [Planctomycetaceae bacterium]|nr:hypothetical protein [Planctomycetaceae bacterium]
PPPIAELAGWTRALHVSVLLAAMGLVATIGGLAAVWVLMQAGLHDPWHSGALGLALGGLLIFPLSRWIERLWWHAALGVAACTLWFGTLDAWWEFFGRSEPSGRWSDAIVWWATTTTIGLGMGCWMLSPRQRRSWGIPPAIVAGCTIAATVNALRDQFLPNGFSPPVIGGPLFDFVMRVQPIVLFVILTSAALGMRLWSAERVVSPPGPALADVFAVWTIFRGLPRWYFARGCPPTLARELQWVRAARTTILLGTIGLATSWISTLWLFGERSLPFASPFGKEGSMVFSPGAWFGLLVLVPLSRWLGRGWTVSSLLVPISTAVYFGAVHLYLRNAFNSDFLSNDLLGGMACGLWGGFGVSVWFIRLRRPRTWWLVPWVAFVGGVVTYGMTVAPSPERLSLPFGLDWLIELFAMNLLFSPFQAFVAMALGARLWWNPPAQLTEPAP